MSTEFIDQAWFWGLRIAYAAAVLTAGVWFAFYISRLARTHAARNPRIDVTLAAFLARAVRYALIIVVLIIVLQMFGVQTASLVAIIGASALAIGLALQGTLTNVASGIIVALMRPYHIGDFVEINGREGRVVDLDLFFTQLETIDNRRVMVPNGQAIANPIVNHTVKGRRCCAIVFGIGYEDDIDAALGVLDAVMIKDSRALGDPAPTLRVTALGQSSVDIAARVWVRMADYGAYRADMLKQVKEAFDAAGIEIPYPHSVQISKGEIPLRQTPIKPKLVREPIG